MKISYNREHDILMYELNSEPIDYAEEVGPIFHILLPLLAMFIVTYSTNTGRSGDE
jgi:hypothetical protein